MRRKVSNLLDSEVDTQDWGAGRVRLAIAVRWGMQTGYAGRWGSRGKPARHGAGGGLRAAPLAVRDGWVGHRGPGSGCLCSRSIAVGRLAVVQQQGALGQQHPGGRPLPVDALHVALASGLVERLPQAAWLKLQAGALSARSQLQGRLHLRPGELTADLRAPELGQWRKAGLTRATATRPSVEQASRVWPSCVHARSATDWAKTLFRMRVGRSPELSHTVTRWSCTGGERSYPLQR